MATLKTNYLSFEILESHNCKLLFLADTSSYLNVDNAEGFLLQILPAGSPSGDIVETNYYPEGLTILNSNTVGLTNVDTEANLGELPDGLWIAKISICPYDRFWFEKKWYRTCQLECKFNKAFLRLELNACNNCPPSKLEQQLDYIERLITGIHANVGDCNWTNANSLYTTANTLLDNILDQDCDSC